MNIVWTQNAMADLTQLVENNQRKILLNYQTDKRHPEKRSRKGTRQARSVKARPFWILESGTN